MGCYRGFGIVRDRTRRRPAFRRRGWTAQRLGDLHSRGRARLHMARHHGRSGAVAQWKINLVGAQRRTPARADLDEIADGNQKKPDIKFYDLADGLRTSEFDGGNSSPGCRTADGILWFPSISGLVRVDPQHIRINTV